MMELKQNTERCKMLSKIEQYILTFYREKLGRMTSEQALQEATDVDEILSKTDPFDTNIRMRFTTMRNSLLEYAVVLEKEELQQQA